MVAFLKKFSQLKTEVLNYFPDAACCAYSINPFFIDPADVGTGEQEELIDIQTDETAKKNIRNAVLSISS